jgi:ribosome maturation factor RimP
MKIDIEAKIKELLNPILGREGFELYDLGVSTGNKNSQVRVFITKPGGVNLSDCETVSNQLSAVLDVDDPFPGSYTLEVSSPGLTRKLTKRVHFEKSIGSYAKLVFKKGFSGPSDAAGFLENRPEGGFRLATKDGGAVDFAFDDVARAKLDFEPGGKG